MAPDTVPVNKGELQTVIARVGPMSSLRACSYLGSTIYCDSTERQASRVMEGW